MSKWRLYGVKGLVLNLFLRDHAKVWDFNKNVNLCVIRGIPDGFIIMTQSSLAKSGARPTDGQRGRIGVRG